MIMKMIKSVPVLGLVLCAGVAHATNIDLTDPVGTNPAFGSYIPSSSSLQYSVDGIDLNVSGWSYKNTFSTSCRWFRCSTTESIQKSTVKDQIGFWANGGHGLSLGLGVENSAAPDHAVDNRGGDYDMLLMSFNQNVSIDTLTAGWIGSSATNVNSSGTSKNGETSVLAYVGSTPLNTDSLKGIEWKSLVGSSNSDWVVIGDSKFAGVNVASTVGTGSVFSSYWLVGAFNSTLGGNGVASGYTDGNDYFKLKGLSVSVGVNPVPLPGSMLLFGAGLIGFGAIRRRKKA